MQNLSETSQQLDRLLNSLTALPAYSGRDDRRLYEFYALKSKLSTYTYCRYSQKIHQINSLISNTHIAENYKVLSQRLAAHNDQSLYANTVIQTNIRQLYEEHYLKINLDYAIFMTREDKINYILLMEEMDALLTSLATQDNTELAPILRRYRQWIRPFRSNDVDIMRSIGITALVLGLHFTPLTLPFIICEIIAFALLGTELIIKGIAYMHNGTLDWVQPREYLLMAEIADDIEQTYHLKPPAFCSRFFSCFQRESSAEDRSNHVADRRRTLCYSSSIGDE